MHDDHPHPLLAQVPLTLSPFLALPTAIPLPYSYKTLPSTLPPSILQSDPTSTSTSNTASNTATSTTISSSTSNQSPPAAYVMSSTGTTATPDQILSSCIALQRHLEQMEEDARRVLGEWEEKRRREVLAEQRRVAPGWLDSGVHILKPEAVEQGREAAQCSEEVPHLMDLDPQAESKKQEGEELDRVFGGLKV